MSAPCARAAPRTAVTSKASCWARQPFSDKQVAVIQAWCGWYPNAAFAPSPTRSDPRSSRLSREFAKARPGLPLWTKFRLLSFRSGESKAGTAFISSTGLDPGGRRRSCRQHRVGLFRIDLGQRRPGPRREEETPRTSKFFASLSRRVRLMRIPF